MELPMLLAGTMLACVMTQDARADRTPPIDVPEPGNVVIVIGEEPGKQKRVIVGSRIPRTPLYDGLSVATSTGLMGLTPGSGFDGAGGDISRTITRKSCTSDDPLISKPAACFMAGALKAEGEGDLRFALGALNSMALSQQFTPHERLAAARHFYRIAEALGSTELRYAAMGVLLDSEGLADAEELPIRRSMIAIALKEGNRPLARELLAELVQRDPADARSLANYAILLREAQDESARAWMTRAIEIAEQAGSEVPQGWRDFVRPEQTLGTIVNP